MPDRSRHPCRRRAGPTGCEQERANNIAGTREGLRLGTAEISAVTHGIRAPRRLADIQYALLVDLDDGGFLKSAAVDELEGSLMQGRLPVKLLRTPFAETTTTRAWYRRFHHQLGIEITCSRTPVLVSLSTLTQNHLR